MFNDFKYEHPLLFRVTLLLIFGLFAGGLVSLVPDTEATRAMGLVALKERATALRSALYWESRAWMTPDGVEVPTVEYGFVVGIDFDGAVFVQIPMNAEFVRKKVKLADIKINPNHLPEIASMIQDKHEVDARIELYGDMAVIWIGGEPLNVGLVTAKLALPDPNPPTNIVDRIFATYFWNKVKGRTV